MLLVCEHLYQRACHSNTSCSAQRRATIARCYQCRWVLGWHPDCRHGRNWSHKSGSQGSHPWYWSLFLIAASTEWQEPLCMSSVQVSKLHNYHCHSSFNLLYLAKRLKILCTSSLMCLHWDDICSQVTRYVANHRLMLPKFWTDTMMASPSTGSIPEMVWVKWLHLHASKGRGAAS